MDEDEGVVGGADEKVDDISNSSNLFSVRTLKGI